MEKGIFELRGNFIQRKITDFFVFYKPKFEFNQIYTKKDKLIFIPKDNKNNCKENYIPCIFFRNPNSSNFLIVFHGNAEDIFTIDNLGLDFRSYLKMNILFVEYPGYSIYMDQNPEPKKIFSDSTIIYDWIKTKFGISDKNIFIYGRSLGTSPAIFLSSQKDPKALFVVSAFTSLKGIGEDKYISPFLEEIFNSNKYIKNVKCPILFIHGKKDTLISYHHSEQLEKEVRRINNSHLTYLEKRDNMTHDSYDIKEDIIFPIDKFLKSNHLISNQNDLIRKDVFDDLFVIPKPISRIIESKTFNIKQFKICKTIEKKNASLLMRLIDDRIAVSNNSKLTLYNDKYYSEDDEIDIGNDDMINCLFQMKNENLILGTKKGYIYIYEILEESKRINTIQLNEEIYKIEVLSSNKICILSKDSIKIYEDDFKEEISSIKSSEKFTDFAEISNYLAFLYDKGLCFYEIQGNTINEKNKNYYIFEQRVYTLSTSNKSLIIGSKSKIFFLELSKDSVQRTSQSFSDYEEDIIFMLKIHDELFLASTDCGNILQIVIDGNNKTIYKDFWTRKKIKSMLLKNIKTILLTDEEKISILTSDRKEDCKAF